MKLDLDLMNFMEHCPISDFIFEKIQTEINIFTKTAKLSLGIILLCVVACKSVILVTSDLIIIVNNTFMSSLCCFVHEIAHQEPNSAIEFPRQLRLIC